jgi:hypothetical protein
MSGELGPLRAPRRTGRERFHRGGEPLGFALADFWAWSVSDLVSNATRGRLAEYLVARALGLSTAGVRNEWSAYDLETPSGIKIEVKSAAYLQAWYQQRLSTVSFSTPPTRAWDPETNIQSTEVARQADVYVFALLAHLDKATLDPLDVSQWEFFVLPTAVLNARTRSQHSITLKSLQTLCNHCLGFDGLAVAVERAAASRAPSA